MTIGTTDYFGFTIVKDEAPSANDWAATYWNWKRLDGALYKAVTEHKHDGAGAISNPTGTLALSSVDTGGSLLSKTYYVCITYIDAAGLETAKSTTATLVINEGLAAPSAPVLVTTGAHTGGLTDTSYSYKLAYAKGSGETVASSPLTVSLPGTAESEITFSFTSITAAANDADKIIIYRRSGTSGSYVKLAEITNTATTSYTDDNTGVPTCDKAPVVYNTTGGENVMTIDWSALDIENAEAIRIYVSTTDTWTGTTLFLAEVDMTVATPPSNYEWDGSPVLSTGKPPAITQTLSNPSKINLATEVTGTLPEDNMGLTWKAPVSTFSELAAGEPGDARVVLDEKAIYIMTDDATPVWQKVSGGGIEIYDYGVNQGTIDPGVAYMIQWEENGVYRLAIGQPNPFSDTTLPTTNRDLLDGTGYYGEYESDMDLFPTPPDYGYGAVRFNWDIKNFEYWDDTIATPAWVAVGA